MMNLVQLQERLKDVPMQALMQYANGGNPNIPPFLALGELNRRKKMQEAAAADQAAEMEGAPTVKQQIEQAAGLMALQGNRQQQAAQQQQTAQANAPMAAPNTMTSEPAQLASGGFINDLVVPRDFQRGGIASAVNPAMLKKLMMLQAMKKRRGLGQLANNAKRPDYAGGGIVAFQTGNLVEDPNASAADVINAAMGNRGDVATDAKSFYSDLIRRRREQKSLADMLREAGIGERPETAKEELAALIAQQQKQAEGDTIARRVLALDPLRLGKSMSDYLSKQEAAEAGLAERIAKIKDLKEKARYDAARGDVEKAQTEMATAIKDEGDLGSKMFRAGYEEQLGESATAGRTTDWVRRYNSYLPIVMQKLGVEDPEDPRVKAATAKMVDESIGLAREKVGIAGAQAETAAAREATQDYEKAASIIDPMIARGGSRYKEYREILKNQGKEQAEAFRSRLIRDEVRRMRGEGSTPTPTPTPKGGTGGTSLPAGLPPGSKLVGTSGGKNVYQLPNGQKVIQQ